MPSVLNASEGKKNVLMLVCTSIINLLPNSGAFGKKQLINEEEDGKSYTEVAVVDNPLYSENEGDVAAYLGEDLEKPDQEEFETEAEVVTNITTCMKHIVGYW